VKSIISSYGEPPISDESLQAGNSASYSACIAAVTSDRDRIAQRLNDDIIRGMFGVGLRLQATAQLTDGTVQSRLELAIRDLDLIIAEVRRVIFDRNPGLHLCSDESTPYSMPDVSQLP
jgi:signal transduction histidine kinase